LENGGKMNEETKSKILAIAAEAKSDGRDQCAIMLERWTRGEVDDEKIKDCTFFCENIDDDEGLEKDLHFFVRAEQAAGIW